MNTRTVEGMLELYEGGKVSRRGLVRALVALAAGLPLRGSAQEPSRVEAPSGGGGGALGNPPIPVVSLNHVTCFVSDLDRTVAFYEELFGMPVQSDQGIGRNLSAGSRTQFVGIYQVGGNAPRLDHLCLGVENFEVDRIMGELQTRGIDARVRMRDGTVPEIYLSDPDGLQIQLQDPAYCGGGGVLGDQCV